MFERINFKNIFFFWFLAFLLIFLVIFDIRDSAKCQTFVFLADSFLHGRLDFMQDLSRECSDISIFEGHYFWALGPLPAILLMPLVASFGLIFKQGYLALVFNLFNFYLLYCLALKLEIKNKIDALWLAMFYIFGTVYFYVALNPVSWYLAHVIATTFLFLALFEFFNKRRWWLIGLFIALGGMTRGTIYFASLFFILYILFEKLRWEEKIKRETSFVLPIIFSFSLLFIYNYLRFNNILEFGYSYQIFGPDLTNARNFGIFSLKHIPGNLFFFLFKGLEPVRINSLSYVLKFPYFRVNRWGLSILFTSPAFLYVFRARWKEKIVKLIWLTILFMMIPIFTYYGLGVEQFGYRYALDFYPFLYLLLIFGVRPRLSLGVKTLIFLGILFDFYLILNFNG